MRASAVRTRCSAVAHRGDAPAGPVRERDIAAAGEATFEADPRLRVLFENGAAPGNAPGLPYSRFEGDFSGWPVPGTRAQPWYFDGGAALADRRPTDGADSYSYDASRSQLTTLVGSGHDTVWLPLPAWQWIPPAPEDAVAYETPPLVSDTVVVGNGSVDLWIKADAPDVDLQATITEVRPDGQEVLVQSGWLRASQRALAARATPLRPLHTNTARDVRPLRAGEWNEARLELFPFGHAFRAGSRIRVIIDTPGGSRPSWKFDVLNDPAGTQIQIGRGANHASRVVLPVVPGVTVPPGLPACPSLRGQPCRPYAAL